MTYNPKKHKRKSFRLKEYDYTQEGLYFVTICCKNRTHFYGEIINHEMVLNDAGKMILKWYYELENKFPDIKCGTMTIMPNHFHCIIQNTGSVRKKPNKQNPLLSEHIGSPLHRVVQWFKTMTTNEYIRNVKSNNWKRFDGKLWQRNYWEHIIRNEKSHHKISEYIKSNPKNWTNDTLKH